MNKIIEYFIQNKRLNYALLVFLAYLGYNAYVNIPKEMFPIVELDKISVRGAYAGASATNMDKMVVRDIEDELSNINGIDKTETTITPGSFIIILTLNENSNRINILSKVYYPKKSRQLFKISYSPLALLPYETSMALSA